MSKIENIIVKVLLANEAEKELRLQISKDTIWQIRIENVQEEHKTCFSDKSVYAAMQSLREYLEAKGCQLLCAGARPDVAPSGMSISMSAGRKAYILHMGVPPSRSDLVDIFDYAEPALVGTVLQQRTFFEDWINSRNLRPLNVVKPRPGEIEEAKRHPNGWVYRIAGRFGSNDRIPPEAIVGAWKVDAHGEIIGEFLRNDKYDSMKWPGGEYCQRLNEGEQTRPQ